MQFKTKLKHNKKSPAECGALNLDLVPCLLVFCDKKQETFPFFFVGVVAL
jgi:hypothetical protein